VEGILVRIAKVISVMLVGPLLGVIAGFLVGGITLNIILKGRHAAPGDGMLIMIFGFAGLLVSRPLSVVLAARLWGQSSAQRGASWQGITNSLSSETYVASVANDPYFRLPSTPRGSQKHDKHQEKGDFQRFSAISENGLFVYRRQRRIAWVLGLVCVYGRIIRRRKRGTRL
jgi:hypothetical protein